jgi:hypothetical protein
MRVLVLVAGRGGARTVAELLARLEERGHAAQLVDADYALIRRSAQFRPDVVLVVSGDASADTRRAVREAGRVCGRAVVSLIPYGLLSHDFGAKAEEFAPGDWCIVANESERRAIVDRFALPAQHVVTGGALEYDAWFDPAPSLDRSDVSGLLGLTGQQPFIVCRTPALEVGQRNLTAYKAQRRMVVAWLRSRTSQGSQPFDILLMSPYGLLKAWRRLMAEVSAEGATCQADPADPLTTRDAIFHSRGLVAVDSISLVEAVIVDRPAYLLRPGEPPLPTPIGDYLASASAVTDSHQDEHCDAALLSPDDRRRFLEETIRPDGISTPAWVGVIRALEHIAAATG